MSQTPSTSDVLTVDAAVGHFMSSVIRRFAFAYLFVIWIAFTLSTLEGFELDLSFLERTVLALTLTALNVTTLLIPWDDLAGTSRGQWWMELYPIVHSLIYGAALVFLSDSPVFPLAMLVVAALGAIYSRPLAIGALAFIPILAVVIHAIDKPDQTDFVTVVQLVILLMVVWVTWTAGRAHRVTLQQAIDAHATATEHARQLAIVTTAARDLQALEPDVVLQALVDSTADLGWDVGGIYVPDPVGEGFVFGAHRNLPPEITEGPQEPIGVFGEIARSGAPVAWPDYPAVADANPKYDGRLGSAAGAPISVHGVARGALVVGASTRREITNQDLQTLELLAGQAGRALELAGEFARQQATVVELERVNELKQDFLATVSHELRTPLAVVLGMAETMDQRWDQMPEPMRRDMTTRMHANAAGLENVIEALLDFSRLERGIVQPRRADVALLDLVQGVVSRLETVTLGHDVAVETGPHQGRGEAFADPLLIERVVENLVVNACRHTPEGTSVRVFVLHDGPNAVVEVVDNGPGIPPGEIEQLGERFFRGGDPHTRSTRGLGLGLAFCGEVLAMHDSQLDITSTLGTGSKFSFALARGRTDDR